MFTLIPALRHLAATTVTAFQDLRYAMFDRYWPELHYMRGPGPKWRERHGSGPLTGH